MLGSEDFVEEIRHRVGEHRKVRASFKRLSVEDLLGAAEKSSGLSREALSGKRRDWRTVAVREAVIVVGRERGISNSELAKGLGIDPSAVTRRVEAARARETETPELKRLRKTVIPKANGGCQRSQA